jgi:uncharacterized delta-60 repeat protein
MKTVYNPMSGSFDLVEDKANKIKYTQGTPADWTTNPQQVAAALDELAARSSGGGPVTTTYGVMDGQVNAPLTSLTNFAKTYDITYTVNRTAPIDSSTISKNLDTFSTYIDGIGYNMSVNPTNNKVTVAHGSVTQFNATTFDVSADLSKKLTGVGALCAATQPDGKILIGGEFTNYELPNINRLVRLNADGSLDTSFILNAVFDGTNPAKFANGAVNSIAIQSNGQILVAGSFTNYAGQTGVSRLIRLNADGTEDTTFTSAAVVSGGVAKFSQDVRVVKVMPTTDIIVVGGNFLDYNGNAAYDYFVALTPSGNISTPLQNMVTNSSGTAKLNGQVFCISFSDNTSPTSMFIGGNFTNFDLLTNHNRIAKFNSVTGVSPTHDVAFGNATSSRFSSPVESIASSQTLSKVYIGTQTVNINGVSGKNYLYATNMSGAEDTTFTTNAVDGSKLNSSVRDVVIHPGGKILISGGFSSYQTTQNSFAVINSDGTPFTTLAGLTYISGSIAAVARQADGKILIGGLFTYGLPSLNKRNLIRLNADGTEDVDFTNNAVVTGGTARISSTVDCIVVKPNGKIVIGGQFTNYFGTGKNQLMQLLSTGAEDTTFSAAAVVNGTTARVNARVRSLAATSGNDVIIGGNFTNYFATGKNNLMRVTDAGAEVTAFSTAAVVNGTTARFNGAVLSIDIHSSTGNIAIGGVWTSYNGTGGYARCFVLNNDGTTNTTISNNLNSTPTTSKFANGQVNTVKFNTDGKLLTGGTFTNWDTGTGKSYLMRFNANGTEDTAFTTAAVTNGTVSYFTQNTAVTSPSINSISISPLGDIVIGGIFDRYLNKYSNLLFLTSTGAENTSYGDLFATKSGVGGRLSTFQNGTITSVVFFNSKRILIGGTFSQSRYLTSAFKTYYAGGFASLENTTFRNTIGKILASPDNLLGWVYTAKNEVSSDDDPGAVINFARDGQITCTSSTLYPTSAAYEILTLTIIEY